MKTNLKVIALILVIISSAIYVGCHDELEENGGITAKNLDNFEGEICNGKQILSFNTLADLQQEHLSLYQQYMTNNEEDQTLIDYENSHSFYSLRKKAEEIADGTIPEEPGFDEMNFTFDPILETLLNQDGMIIIGDRLYMWDSGCIIHNIPFSCANYENLLAFHQGAQSGSTDSMYGIYINNDMKSINICDDKYFDFETISENGGRIEGGGPKLKNKNHCGYEVALNAKLIACDDATYTYKVSPQTIQPAGTNPFDIYYVKATVGDADGIEISTELLGSWGSVSLGPDGEYGYIVPFNSDYFYIRIPVTNDTAPSLIVDITIYSVIGIFTGNSCAASSTTSINNQCPFTIEKTKNFVSADQAQWTFSINGTANCTLPGGKVKWVFGDGTVIEEGGYTETHTYSVPCEMKDITVTATIDGVVCNTDDKLFTTTIPVGNPCTRSNYTFTTNTDHEINGKKVKLKAKIKRNWSGKTVFKNVFKCKTTGSKVINSEGSIYKSSGSNDNCVPIDISSVVPSNTTIGIKRNKQKVVSSTHYFINAADPYQVKFTHPGTSSTFVLTSGLTCSQ